MKDIFENKLVLYKDAARKYNAGVASGEFDRNIYKPHNIRDDFDMSVFEFPLTSPPGAELIEEIKDPNDNNKVVAIIYEYNGKRFKKFINGTITEIKPETKDDDEIILP